MALPQPPNGEGLREVVSHRGVVRLRGDDAADGEAVGPHVGVSKQPREEVFLETGFLAYPVLGNSRKHIALLREGSMRRLPVGVFYYEGIGGYDTVTL